MDTVKSAQQKREEAIQKRLSKKAALRSIANSLGAIPAGARGVRDGGRAQHSTNLCLDEPATAIYVCQKHAGKKHGLKDANSVDVARDHSDAPGEGKPPANKRNTNDIANAAKVDLAAASRELKSKTFQANLRASLNLTKSKLQKSNVPMPKW